MHIESSGQKKKSRVTLDATAGALSGCIARFIVGPLDVIKIRFQVQLEPIKNLPRGPSKYTSIGQALTTIVREEGIQGLWRGTIPGQLLTIPYTAVQFVALQQCRDFAAQMGLTSNPSMSPLISFTSGALAGAAGTIASYPFDLLRTTLAAQGEPKVYRGMFDAARGIVREQGPSGLYRGLGVTLVEIMPYAALQFGLYDLFNSLYAQAQDHFSRSSSSSSSPSSSSSSSSSSPSSPSKVQYFTCGLLAGLLAKLATHPLDVAKKRYQVAGLQRSLKYGARVEKGLVTQSLSTCLAEIYRLEGIRGLWKGSMPSIMKAAPNAALTFVAYEAIVAFLLAAQEKAGQQQQKQQKL